MKPFTLWTKDIKISIEISTLGTYRRLRFGCKFDGNGTFRGDRPLLARTRLNEWGKASYEVYFRSGPNNRAAFPGSGLWYRIT